jgi:hypothetical protein
VTSVARASIPSPGCTQVNGLDFGELALATLSMGRVDFMAAERPRRIPRLSATRSESVKWCCDLREDCDRPDRRSSSLHPKVALKS